MSKATVIADKASGIALGVIALANLLFVISFAIVLLIGASTVKAAALQACTGENLLQQLEKEDPGKLAELRLEAARTPNGQGLLWKVEKDGVEPSFLFGTIHLTDERVTKLTAEAQAAFDDARTVVIETTDILDEKQAAISLMSHPELMMLPGTTTLKSLLSPEDAEVVNQALEERGIPPGSVAKMQPWLLTSMVSIPACEFSRRRSGLEVLDAKLARDAEAAGKAIAGLETAVSQLRAMASLPLELHVEGLVQTLKLGDRLDDVFETMIALYEARDIGIIWPLAKTMVPSAKNGYAEFEQVMVVTRNHGMVENAEPHLDAGGAFIAVGALHLPGEEGLVALLRQAGYRVTRAD